MTETTIEGKDLQTIITTNEGKDLQTIIKNSNSKKKK